MKAAIGFCLMLLIWGFLISGCATRPLPHQQAASPVQKVDAHGLFVENCAICHGQNGRAHTVHGWLVGARNLTKPKWQDHATDDDIHEAIESGPGVMPAFGKKLSSPEIDALAAYVRTLRQKN